MPWRLYSVYDSFYSKSRIFTVNAARKPARIEKELVIRDRYGKLAQSKSVSFRDVDAHCEPISDPKTLSLADLVNDDGTVNLDPEGIAVTRHGGFYIASEGSGNLVCEEGEVGVSEVDGARPFQSPNLIVKVNRHGAITAVIQLPESVARKQARFGLEGITTRWERGREILYVAFQRDWDGARNANGDPSGATGQFSRIGRYDTRTRAWTFLYYQLAEPTSSNGGWVGLSEIQATGQGDEFLVIERDNQAGPDASLKRITSFVADPRDFVPDSALTHANLVSFQAVTNDLLDELKAPGGLVLEKVEGLTLLPGSKAAIVTDNDGVDDASGETQFLIVDQVDPNDI